MGLYGGLEGPSLEGAPLKEALLKGASPKRAYRKRGLIKTGPHAERPALNHGAAPERAGEGGRGAVFLRGPGSIGGNVGNSDVLSPVRYLLTGNLPVAISKRFVQQARLFAS